ncbi:MAG: T9SS type A sorting domain-containing protein [Saprospiraceae bacterium]
MKTILFLLVAFVICHHPVYSQCYPNRHSTNFFDGWISCEAAPNPNPDRPVSHFIMYDFGKIYKLGQMEIWNTNDPAHLDWGMRDVAIDYSVDGATWATAGTFTFPQASGLSTYEGAAGPDLDGVEGRYLLLTAMNNYGGDCFGLSEFRVSGEEVVVTDVANVAKLDCIDVSIFPNPFTEKMNMVLAPGCSGDLHYTLYDALGHKIVSEKSSLISGQEKAIEIGRSLPAGSYLMTIEFGGKSINKSIIKMSKT